MTAFFRRLLLLALIGFVPTSLSSLDAQTIEHKAAEAHPRVSIQLRDLGTIEGSDAFAKSINNRGDIVGAAGGFPFLWTATKGFERFLGRTTGSARDINDLGEVVGVTGTFDPDDGDGDSQWNNGDLNGFLWSRQGGLIDLGDSFFPRSINNRGHITGSCFVEEDPGDGPYLELCVWRNGVLTRLGLPTYDNTIAQSINDRGDITMIAGGSGSGETGHLWRADRGFIELDDRQPVGPLWTEGRAINDSGDVAGGFEIEDPNNSPGFLAAAVWSRQGTLLRVLPEHNAAVGINARGWVVGPSYLWLPSGLVTALPLPEGGQGGPSAINDRNEIVGAVRSSENGKIHVALWTAGVDPLNITTPNLPSRWGLGTIQRLAWSYGGNAPQFQIEISRNRGSTWDYLTTVPNQPGGSHDFAWRVTGSLANAARFRVSAIGDAAAVDVNDADIRIARATIEMLSPTADTSVALGSRLTIFYRHSLGARTPVAIDSSASNGTT